LAINATMIAWFGLASWRGVPVSRSPPSVGPTLNFLIERTAPDGESRPRSPSAPPRPVRSMTPNPDLAPGRVPTTAPSPGAVAAPPAAGVPGAGSAGASAETAAPGLRKGLGCLYADFLRLSAEEREACAQAAATAGPTLAEVDPLSHIDPEKRALFDAQAKADSGPQHMAGVFCMVRFGVGGTSQIRIVEARKLGRLPCFVVGPKATIVEEHAK